LLSDAAGGRDPVPHLNGTFTGELRREEISCCRGLSLSGTSREKVPVKEGRFKILDDLT
jgi:hypothetical protein